MPTLLHLDSSPRGDRSHSRRLSAHFVEQWLAVHRDDAVVYRDLREFTPPNVTEDWIAAAFTPADGRSPQMQGSLQTSDLLVDEFLSADVYVFGVPLYNFATPSIFKAYVDNIVRVGRTFLFEPEDVTAQYKPLVHGKRMFVLVSSGDAGYGPGGPLWKLNHLEPHLRTVFGFIGITDLTFIYAGNDEFGGERLASSVNHALAQIRGIARANV